MPYRTPLASLFPIIEFILKLIESKICKAETYIFPDYWVYFKALPVFLPRFLWLFHFQTIESILKLSGVKPLWFMAVGFPDYWVYFKADKSFTTTGFNTFNFQTIESILKRICIVGAIQSHGDFQTIESILKH